MHNVFNMVILPFTHFWLHFILQKRGSHHKNGSISKKTYIIKVALKVSCCQTLAKPGVRVTQFCFLNGRHWKKCWKLSIIYCSVILFFSFFFISFTGKMDECGGDNTDFSCPNFDFDHTGDNDLLACDGELEFYNQPVI